MQIYDEAPVHENDQDERGVGERADSAQHEPLRRTREPPRASWIERSTASVVHAVASTRKLKTSNESCAISCDTLSS